MLCTLENLLTAICQISGISLQFICLTPLTENFSLNPHFVCVYIYKYIYRERTLSWTVNLLSGLLSPWNGWFISSVVTWNPARTAPIYLCWEGKKYFSLAFSECRTSLHASLKKKLIIIIWKICVLELPPWTSTRPHIAYTRQLFDRVITYE